MFREEPTQKPSPAAQSPGEDNSDLLTYVFIVCNQFEVRGKGSTSYVNQHPWSYSEIIFKKALSKGR